MNIKKYWNKSNINKLIIIISVLWIILAIIFAFYDLNISKLITNQNSSLGRFIELYSEIPSFLLIIFSLLIFISGFKHKNKIVEYSLLFFIFFVNSILFYYSLSIVLFQVTSFRTLFLKLDYILYFIFSIFINGILIYLFKTKLKKFSLKYFKISKIVILLFIISYLIFGGFIKEIWGRVRFRDLVVGHSNFTPWYLPIGINGSHSFPSGHAILAWILLPLTLFALNKKFIKTTILLLVTLWGLLISFFRVYFGAHFASDVLFSSCFTIIVFLILYKKYYLKI